MKNRSLRRILAGMLALVLALGCVPPVTAADTMTLTWEESDVDTRPAYAKPVNGKTDEPKYLPEDIVRVSIVLGGKPTIRAGYSTGSIATNAQAQAYREQLKTEQLRVASAISAKALDGAPLDVVWNLTLVGNLISANVPYGKIDAIKKVLGVQDVILENRYTSCAVERGSTVQPQMYASLGMTGSTLLWSSGFTGAGSRIAVIDTGTDITHQSLDNGAFLYALQQNAAAKGMTYDAYLSGLDLLDVQEIAAVLPSLNIYAVDSSITAAKLYRNEKHPFGVNYVDYGSGRLEISHLADNKGEHGSHVAGIAAANRYIPTNTGYEDALTSVSMSGVAPDAQLLTMKVFGQNAPYDSDFMAAIEDAILLGCDAVNLSLGTASAGSSRNNYFADLLEYMTQTDTVVVASAGNASSWPTATGYGYLYSSDVNFDTVGSPGSHGSLLTVASVNNIGGIGPCFGFNGAYVAYQDYGGGYYNTFTTLDTSKDKSGTDYEFVFVDGLGYPEDYAGMDLSGKIVFCSRGITNFADKANTAVSLGAVATVVYNNESGPFGMDLTGYNYTAPAVSISLEDGYNIRAGAQPRRTGSGLTYYTGTITVYGRLQSIGNAENTYTMSDFSSWGVPGDLSLKPEITAPGGDIYSLWGRNQVNGGGSNMYEPMSGTSMAAPHITGMAAVLAQCLRERGVTGISVRKLTQSLLMSTATPIREADSGGNYYSLLKQGAGLARLDLAAMADSYILVTGQDDGKVKAELGDDPSRTGVYSFSFSINNLTDHALSYALSADLFAQDAFYYNGSDSELLLDTWTAPLGATATFTANGRVISAGGGSGNHDLNGDGVTDVEDANLLLAYLLGTESTLHGDGDVDGDGVITSYDAHLLLTPQEQTTPTVTVPAGSSATVQVRLVLDAAAREKLNSNYPNGTYVEGFIYAKSVIGTEGEVGTCHSIPMLAFYGNWSDAPMFDHCTYAEINDSGAEHTPYLYSYTGPFGNCLSIDYGDGELCYYGGNPYSEDVPYVPENNAFSSENGSRLAFQEYTLIRSAAASWITVSNADTGEVYFQRDLGEHYSAYYDPNYGSFMDVVLSAGLNWYGTDGSGYPLADGTKVEVTLTAVPEYYVNADGSVKQHSLGDGVTMTTGFTIDNVLPQVLDWQLEDTTLHITAQDNRHVAAVSLLSVNGDLTFATQSPENPRLGEPVDISLDLSMLTGTRFLLAVYDYAGNEHSYEVTLDLPEMERYRFTAVNQTSNSYCTVDVNGDSATLATCPGRSVMAAEFVDGYVFEVSNSRQLWVGRDDDLYSFRYVADLDPNNIYGITNFLDLAYNYADGKLYGLFYCNWNDEVTSLLCTIDMETGYMDVLGEMPVDASNLAIDDEGNFYSVVYDASMLYTYTLQDFENGTACFIGGTGYYRTASPNSLAWDHDADALYWAHPNTFLKLNHRTAEPTLLFHMSDAYVGLYIRPETWEDRFTPTDTVSCVIMDFSELRVPIQQTSSLQTRVYPWFVTNDNVIWSSSNESIATVDQDGTVHGISQGSAVITASSVLDPSKQAACTVEVVDLSKDLNAIIWDEAGDVWWTEFNTSRLPEYTKISENAVSDIICTTALTPDGTLYAGTLDIGSFTSSLYRVNPDTLEMTWVGNCMDGYTDLAPAPSMPGETLAATFGPNILLVDATTGDYYAWFDLFSRNVVGIAYAGTEVYRDWGFDTWLDWYFIVDTAGTVYLISFLKQYNSYYYVEHPDTDAGVFAETGITTDVPYFSSLYFDGEFLYYACFRESTNNVTLYAIDTSSTREAFCLGTFADNVWPVGGLFELGNPPSTVPLRAAPIAEPQLMETGAPIVPQFRSVTKTPAEPVSTGGPNAAVQPQTDEEYVPEDSEEYVNILLPQESVSGILELRFDPEELEVESVSCNTTAYAWTVENGCVKIAYASEHMLLQDSQIAVVTFVSKPTGDHTATLRHTQLGRDSVDISQSFLLHGHSYTATVTEPTCTQWGMTVMVCECGASYPGENIPPLGHDMGAWYTYSQASCIATGEERRECSRCGVYEAREAGLGDHRYMDGRCVICGDLCLGDVNGDGIIDAADVCWVIQYYKEQRAFTENQLTLADVDGNGRVDMADAYCIILYINAQIDSFPAENG